LIIGITQLQSQNHGETQTKIKIVEKEINGSGEVIEKVIELVGEDAERYMKDHKMKMEKDNDVEKEVEIKVDKRGTSEAESYKIKVIENGEEKIMEWDGEGEMPEGMQKIMMENDIQMQEERIKRRIKKSSTEGAVERRENKKTQVQQIDKEWYKKHQTFDYYDPNKAILGVTVSNENGEVFIKKVMENSVAQRSGLAVGDVITKIEEIDIDSVKKLVDTIASYKPGDTVLMQINISGQEKEIKVHF